MTRRSGVRGAIVNRDNLEFGIINRDERGESARELLLLVARGEDQRDTWALGVGSLNAFLQPGQATRPVGNFQSVSQPEDGNQSEENRHEEMHVNWSRKPASEYPSTNG